MADSELQSFFSPGKPLEPDVLSELQSILRIHDLSAEDLYLKWEAYCIKLDIEAQDISLTAIRNLKQSIQDTLEKTSQLRQTQPRVAATPRVGGPRGGGSDVFGMLDGLLPTTPATGGKIGKPAGNSLKRKMETPKGVGSSPAAALGDQLKGMNGAAATSFNDRANPGEVIEVLNTDIAPAEPPIAPFAAPRIKLTAGSDQKKMTYKPLAMKLSEASEILDDRIDEFIELVQKHHELEDSAFGSAANQGTTEIVTVGRIASDSMEGKLNAASLVLETSRRTGMALRVPLDVDKLPSWSFFPGQIVALRGSNMSGKKFVATEALDLPLLQSAASAPEALEAHRERLRGDPDSMDTDSDPPPLNIIFAAGPYTADDNLDFEPLHALCDKAADTYADAVVLAGPFIDIDHPLIAIGDFDLPEEANYEPDTATMTTVFKYLFAPALNRLVSANPHVAIIMVPSVRDVLDKHVSWPQDIIPRKDLGLPKAVRLVSNPMSLSINELLLGVSSQDILYELRTEELTRAADSNLMGRLCRHLVEQRHYFPLFPPTDRSKLLKTGTEEGVATGSMLDLSYIKLGEMINVKPDVLLTPSTLPPFARVVESVVTVNPGRLSKRRGAGTYARMTVYPLKADPSGGMASHKIHERARVEIVKI